MARGSGVPAELRNLGVTPREAEVLGLLGGRLTNQEIAERLVVSVRTVESHVSSLLAKLGAADRLELSGRSRSILAGTRSVPIALRALRERGPLVGRLDELDRLGRLWWGVSRGGGRPVAVLRGDAGVGKTRLAAELAASVAEAGGPVRLGRFERDDTTPYAAFVGAFEGLDRILLSASGDADRFRVFEEADRAVGASAPSLLVLDDLHWADTGSVLLLRHMASRQQRAPLLFVATCRTDEQLPPWVLSLVVDLRRAGILEDLQLGALEGDDARALAARAVGEADPAAVDEAVRRTGGNAFFLQQLAEHVALGGDPREVPLGVHELVRHRVSSLGAATARVLRLAAVAGRSSTRRVLAAASGADEEALVAAAGSAVAARLLVDAGEGRYEFTHDLVQEALYAEVPVTDRQELHRLLAEALGQTGGEDAVVEIALHLHAAGATSTDVAVRAARRLERGLAYERAAAFYGMAAGAAASDVHRAELLVAEGACWRRAGDDARARLRFEAAAAAARAAGSASLLADAATGAAEAAPLWTDDASLAGLLEEAYEALGDAERARRSVLLGALALARYYATTPAQREVTTAAAVDLATRSGDDHALAAALSARHVALWGPDTLDERLEAAAAVVALAERTGDRELAARGHGWLVVDRMEAGDLAGAESAVSAHAGLAAELAQPALRRDQRAWQVMRAALHGRFADAAIALDDLRPTALGDPVGADEVSLTLRWWLALEVGHGAWLDELEAAFAPVADERPHVPAWRSSLALLLARRGRLDEAAGHVRRALRDGVEAIPRDAVWLHCLACLAEASSLCGLRDAAGALHRALEPHVAKVVPIDRGFVCQGSVARYAGLAAGAAGRVASALELLDRAQAVHDSVGSPPLSARTHLDVARVVAASDPGAARRRAAEAREVAGRLGMSPLHDDAAALLGRLG